MSEEKKEEKKLTGFDASQPITINLKSTGGGKFITVRYPTDAEWMERQKERKVIVKQIGRMSKTIPPDSSDYDEKMFAKIRTDSDGPGVDGYEAMHILEQLSQCDIDDVVREGTGYRVTMRILGGLQTSDLIKMPSAKDIFDYRRAFVESLDLPNSKQRLTINLQAAADLHKKLSESTMGYAGAMPIIHQAIAIRAAIDETESEDKDKSGMGVSGSENF
jgi:hypothetical protein